MNLPARIGLGVAVLAALSALAARRMPWPVPSAFITDPFGSPRSYGPHNGVDLRAPIGTPVTAPRGGVVLDVSSSDSSGRYLVAMLDNGLRAGFAHLSDAVLSVGDRFALGELLAFTGDSGAPGQPHLHYTLKRGDVWIDPESLSA